MALTEWLGRQQRQQALRTPRLDARGVWPARLVAFSSSGWHSFIRSGAQTTGWAERTRSIDRPRFMDIPIGFWKNQRSWEAPVRPRAQYRQAMPAKKTYALAQALRQSAEAIQAKRG